MDTWGTVLFSDDVAPDRADRFSQSLEMLDNGCLPDPALDAENILLMLAQRYAYVLPSDSTLAILAALGPLVEVGAGTGYWAHRLRSIGVDIVAFDQAPVDGERTNRYHPRTRPWTHVEQGDQTTLAGHADRGLFLCWPPLFSSLGDCLTYYSGHTIACIGDGGYRTARLDQLHESFTKVATAPVRALDPYPGARPQLTIWKRTPDNTSPSPGRSGVSQPRRLRVHPLRTTKFCDSTGVAWGREPRARLAARSVGAPGRRRNLRNLAPPGLTPRTLPDKNFADAGPLAATFPEDDIQFVLRHGVLLAWSRALRVPCSRATRLRVRWSHLPANATSNESLQSNRGTHTTYSA